MTQDESEQDRVDRVAQSLAPKFDQTRMDLAKAIIAAEDGHVIEQTERIIYDQLNRLKTTTQQVGMQERVQEAEAAFFPSCQATKTSQ